MDAVARPDRKCHGVLLDSAETGFGVPVSEAATKPGPARARHKAFADKVLSLSPALIKGAGVTLEVRGTLKRAPSCHLSPGTCLGSVIGKTRASSRAWLFLPYRITAQTCSASGKKACGTRTLP